MCLQITYIFLKINKKKKYNKNKIINIRKKRIKYVNKSVNRTVMKVLKICKNYENSNSI